ncbi:hypothetical protein LCGC14_2726060 [marine sediment metagenome]|uniref:Uncharacterized protein n=1 Tax=marine sediment metagenome TaxID=412755 RepID=A0A0F9C0D8_9ZZZZ
MTTQTEDRTCNGWTNYETWVTALWMDNEEYTQEIQQAWKRQAIATPKNEVWTKEETERFTLADIIKDYVEENNPLASDASMYSDLMRAAIQEVNWQEIADSILSG